MDKNKILYQLSDLILEKKDEILAANKLDLENVENIDPVLLDRLKIDKDKIDGMVKSITDVIRLEDPVGKVLNSYLHPNGMVVVNKTVPFGLILIVYESRPDVTIEAACNAFKAGNRIFLKGGKEARHTNLALVNLWQEVLEQNGISKDFVTYLDLTREETQELIEDNNHDIDLIIPRGGEGLISFIKDHTDIPVLVSGRGNNFAYVHHDADFDMVRDIVVNGKSRLSVCNALDKVLFSRLWPDLDQKLNMLAEELRENGINVLTTPNLGDFNLGSTEVKGTETMYEEYLSANILLDMVVNEHHAIETINLYSGGHSAVIITEDKNLASHFQDEVDCGAVYHNASTRFTDGGQFGLGAEIAISTQKIHFRGPVGMAQLVSNKWYINGAGQVR